MDSIEKGADPLLAVTPDIYGNSDVTEAFLRAPDVVIYHGVPMSSALARALMEQELK